MDCECHGEPQLWNRDPRYREGGYWVCRTRRSEQNKRHLPKKRAWLDRARDDFAFREMANLKQNQKSRGATLAKARTEIPARPAMIDFLRRVRANG